MRALVSLGPDRDAGRAKPIEDHPGASAADGTGNGIRQRHEAMLHKTSNSNSGSSLAYKREDGKDGVFNPDLILTQNPILDCITIRFCQANSFPFYIPLSLLTLQG